MHGQQIIQRPEHVGIANGMLTVGVDYPDVASVHGLWAPPYVSSDFHLECRVNGQPVPTTKWLWRPFQVEREGGLRSGVHLDRDDADLRAACGRGAVCTAQRE